MNNGERFEFKETKTRTSSRQALCQVILLDPEKETRKVTKEIGSEKGQNKLKEKGCGPPRPGMRYFLQFN